MNSFVKPEKIRVLVQNIRDIRKNKIDTLLLAKLANNSISAQGLTACEISEIRQFLDESFRTCDELQAQYENFNIRDQAKSQKFQSMSTFSPSI